MGDVPQQIIVPQQENGDGDGEGSGVVQRIIDKLDNNNFKEEINEQGDKTFKCNICQEIFSQPRDVRRHITVKHLKVDSPNCNKKKRPADKDSIEEVEAKKQKEDGEQHNAETFVFSETMLAEFENTNADFATSTQSLDDSEITQENVTVVTLDTKTLQDNITELEELVNINREKRAELESRLEASEQSIKEKEEQVNVLNGIISSLEEEKKVINEKMLYYNKTVPHMMAELHKLRAKSKENVNSELIKVKKDLKQKAKELEESDKKIEHLQNINREETNARAKAEADLVLSQKLVESLKELLLKKSELGQEKSKEICRDYSRNGSCQYGASCRFLHRLEQDNRQEINQVAESIRVEENEKPDCRFWLAGQCKFSDSHCRSFHDPVKRGSKPWKETIEEVKPDATKKVDFMESLVKAVSQELAGGKSQAQPGKQQENKVAQQTTMENAPQGLAFQQNFPNNQMYTMIQPGQNQFQNQHPVLGNSHPMLNLMQPVMMLPQVPRLDQRMVMMGQGFQPPPQ